MVRANKKAPGIAAHGANANKRNPSDYQAIINENTQARKGADLRDEGMKALACRVPPEEIKAAAAALFAGLRKLGGAATAEKAWRSVGHYPSPQAACLSVAITSKRGLIEMVGAEPATTPRAHRGIVRRWRIAECDL